MGQVISFPAHRVSTTTVHVMPAARDRWAVILDGPHADCFEETLDTYEDARGFAEGVQLGTNWVILDWSTGSAA